MDAIPIFLISLGTAYLAGRLARRGPFTLADLATGVTAGLVALSMTRLLNAEGSGVRLGLPLIAACILTLGLESLQRRAALH